MSAEAYPDRDGRTYNNHGIEHTLAQFTTGDTVHVDADMAAPTGARTRSRATVSIRTSTSPSKMKTDSRAVSAAL